MIEAAIATFRRTLASGWGALEELERVSPVKSLTHDWAQASWEMIVEGALTTPNESVRLVVYGDGADVHRLSSRVSFPEALPTHVVVATAFANPIDQLTGGPLSSSDGEWEFDRLVAMVDGWYVEAAPFDHILLTRHGKEAVVRWADIRFSVRRC